MRYILGALFAGVMVLLVLLWDGEKLPTPDVMMRETTEVAATPIVEEEKNDEAQPPLTTSPASGGIPLHLTREDGGGEGGEVGLLVLRVVDGDTIEIDGGERVRYIGVNTPESVDPRRKVQCFGKEASAYNKKLVEGKRVRLESDVEDRDKYNRLLRYVWLGDTMVNEQLVADGYAQLMTIPPNVQYVERFRAAQTQARGAKRGLWAKCKK